MPAFDVGDLAILQNPENPEHARFVGCHAVVTSRMTFPEVSYWVHVLVAGDHDFICEPHQLRRPDLPEADGVLATADGRRRT
jgi:hypothetical protein